MSSSFSALGVRAELVACLDDLGIASAYPIQTATLPDGLAGRDLFAQSPTGTGKTLAFALPLVSRIGKARSARPRGLVLAPTRELAAQISAAVEPLARVLGRSVAAFYGGTGYRDQLNALRQGVDVVVGCPGRLIDLLDRGALDLREVQVVVVDEADRMADMGFLPAVRRLLDEIGGERQTMLFSATLTGDVERLVRDYQQAPSRHRLEHATDDLGSRRHEFWRSKKEDRAALTARLVAGEESSIVFCRTKHGADRLTRQLSQSGVAAVAIHGDRSQAQRDRALEHFKARKAQVLVGTDVASRGLHVEGVDLVVHFDPPEDDDTYVHRSGRTGRAGASGRVVSLLTPDQESDAQRMQKRLGIAAPVGPPPALPEVVARRPVEIHAEPRPVGLAKVHRPGPQQPFNGSAAASTARRKFRPRQASGRGAANATAQRSAPAGRNRSRRAR